MAILGARGTGDWGADERPKDFREMILWRNPNGKAPLFALTSKLGKRNLTDPEFNWWEEELNVLTLQVNDGTGLTAGDTTLTVDGADARLAQPGDIFMVETTFDGSFSNEMVIVSSVNSSTELTIQRGAMGTSAGAIADDAYLTRVGSVHAEGSGGAASGGRNPTKFYNYAQIFKTAFEITGTAAETKSRTGDAFSNDQKRRTFDHSAKIEMAILFGRKWEGTGANGKPMRTMGGIAEFLANAGQVKRYSSSPTVTTFIDDVYSVFDYDGAGVTAGDERLILAGNTAINKLNQLAKADGGIQFHETVKLYGMNLQKWVLPQGTLYIKSHPLLNVHPIHKSTMMIIDPPALKWAPLRDTKIDKGPNGKGIQANDEDVKKHQYLTEAGLEVTHSKTMKILANVA